MSFGGLVKKTRQSMSCGDEVTIRRYSVHGGIYVDKETDDG
jgi:hypothetical protein